MRILYVALLHSVHARRWIQYFADRGHDVHVISFVEPKAALKNVRIHVVKPAGNVLANVIILLPFIRKVRGLVRGINPDIIHIHQLFFIYRFIFTRVSCPLVATPWGSDILLKPKKNPFIRWCLERLVRACDAFICDAAHLKRKLIELGAAAERVAIIYFGTDVDDFHPGQRDPSIRERFHVGKNAPLIGSLRALHPVYDIQTLIRAAPLVLQEVPAARFLIVGDGPDKEKLMALAEELGSGDRVRFAGRVSDEDLRTICASIDVYVSTSLSDGGLAASTAEAMASQVPVVISDFGENKDWVEEGESGMIFPCGDFWLLAEKIVYLLKNPHTARQMASNGRHVIETRNNYAVEMDKAGRLYDRLVQERRRRGVPGEAGTSDNAKSQHSHSA